MLITGASEVLSNPSIAISGNAYPSALTHANTAVRTYQTPDISGQVIVNILINQAAHGFTTGQAIYYTGTAWALAEANSASTLGIGLVIYVDTNNFYLCQSGLITGLSGLTAGQYYFVSDATPGALTSTSPVASTSFSNPLLFSLSTTSGIVIPFRPAQALQAANFAAEYDFLLDCEPMQTNLTYTATYNGLYVSNEAWYVAGPTLLKNIAYTYTAGNMTTEVRKVFAGNGVTILAQSTIVYTYSSNIVVSATYTRNI